jgi:CheY-like chemotaxis protein
LGPLATSPEFECEAPSPVTGEAAILVVDDDPLSARVAEIVLAAAGCKVTTMAQAKVADLVAARCDVMMLDRRLGRADGVELALAFRNVESAMTPRRTIILVTADIEELDQTVLAAAGIDAVVRKPYTPTDLLSALDRAWPVREARTRSV